MTPARGQARGCDDGDRLIWHSARVVRLAGEAPRLAFSDASACVRCARGTGCGAAHLARLFVRGSPLLPLNAGESLEHGALVRVGVRPGWLLAAATAGYLLPTVAFVLGAAAGHLAWPGDDPFALAAGLAAAAAALAALRLGPGSLARPQMVVEPLGARSKGALESAGDCAHLGGHGGEVPPGRSTDHHAAVRSSGRSIAALTGTSHPNKGN